MADFLNTSATNYYLEELIKNAREHLIIISPFLKFNTRIKELLEDKNRMKIDIRIVYGKSELAPQEINWLRSLDYVRTSFCQNLHAKCYANEGIAIITSMNLYDFSQQNNNEMGVLISRDAEPELYTKALDEAQRLFRIAEPVRLSAEKVEEPKHRDEEEFDKLSTSRLASALGTTTSALSAKLIASGLLTQEGSQYKLTAAGKKAGGEFRYSKKFGPYFLWPKDLQV